MLNLDLLKENIKTMLSNMETKIQNIALLPHFGAFYNRAKNLSGLLDKYTNEDGGSLPILTEKDYSEILNILTEMSSEKQLFDMNVYRYYGVMNYWPNFPQRYWRSIAEKIEPYRETFLFFDFKKPSTLKNMFEAAIGAFVPDIIDKPANFNREKFATGKKFEFDYIDDKKNKVKGFFQADKRFVIKTEYNNVASQIAIDYPKYAGFFNHIANEIDFTSTARELKYLPKCFNVEKNEIDLLKFIDIINNANLGVKENQYIAKMINEEGFKIALFDFARKIDKLNKKFDVNVNKLGLSEKESLTQRAAAVTKLAEMTGLKDVIPEANNMVVTHNDNTYKGVFEKKAIGVELGSISNSDEIRTFGKEQFETKEAIKAMSKLQILDFITGNVNRDKNKLFLQFDKSGNVIGIQGISNKTSFTTKTGEKIGNMPSLESLKVIDKETADKLATMDENELKNVLSGFNMSNEAIEQACNRCKELQTLIKENKISVLKDDEWNNVKLDDLVDEKENNYFNMLKEIPEMLKKPRELNTELNKDSYIQEYLLTAEVNTIEEEIKPFMNELKLADKTFFKKNNKCNEVFEKFNQVIKDTKNNDLKIKDETEFVAYLDISLISVQSKISEIRFNIMNEKNRNELSAKDKARVEALDNLDKFIYAKMDILNKKYGDKAETEMKIQDDIKKCSIAPKKELTNKLKDSLNKNVEKEPAKTQKVETKEIKKDDLKIDPLKKKNN